jgi:hypothetical protein
MATRRQVREAFYSELETAASPHLSPGDIRQEDPNAAELLPTIVHNDAYRPNPMHTGSAPVSVTTDASGNIDSITFGRVMEAVFGLLIRAEDEQTKENIYESVRSHFEKYTYPIKEESSIQTDVHSVSVGESVSDDNEERSPRSRGDRLQVSLGYERLETLVRGTDFESVSDIEHRNDAGTDGTIEEIYNTT